MNRIITVTVSALSALSLGTMAYAVATSGPASAAVKPAAVHAPHAVSCRTKLIVIVDAERGTSGAAALQSAGLPGLAEAARSATTLRGATSYGIQLASEAHYLNGCRHARKQDDGIELPSWFRWVGGTHDKCITVWGQPAHKAGNTSARVCRSGYAGLS